MSEESPESSSRPTGAVFLSYASQDAEAAQRICAALRSAGVEVWFDQSELRGGDVWDRQIRRQIRECALFVPIISASAQARPEGYFRLEWDLADQRTHLMGRSRAFVLPVCTDATPEREADVPDSFLAAQWTRLPGGATTPAFVARIKRLLFPELSPSSTASTRATAVTEPAPVPRRLKPVVLSIIAIVCVALLYLAANRFSVPRHSGIVAGDTTSAPPQPAAAFNPPPHSIAVLPFVNLSGDKEQDYFSDGLTEEFLNSLAEINELQVAARTSSFSFKDHTDIATVAHKLNVGAVLEGSVRRSSHTLRITAQLINAVTGFHLWSKTYDRDLGDVLKLQTEIATAVASALKVTLLGDVAAKVELGGTHNPPPSMRICAAPRRMGRDTNAEIAPTAIAAYTEAIRLDPHYALAFASRSIALSGARRRSRDAMRRMREGFDKAQADARQALALAPDLAQAHLALALTSELASTSRRRARHTTGPSRSRRAMRRSCDEAAVFAAYMGHFDGGLAAARRAVALDPLAREAIPLLGRALYAARRYQEAVAAFAEVISLEPGFKDTYGERGLAYYGLGDLQSATRLMRDQAGLLGKSIVPRGDL